MRNSKTSVSAPAGPRRRQRPARQASTRELQKPEAPAGYDADHPASPAHDNRLRASNGYEVGYARPPTASQFKPGQSGNPRGRPKGSLGLKTVVAKIANERIAISGSGRKKKISVLEATLLRLRNDALAGNARAIAALLAQFDRHLQENERVDATHDLSVADGEMLQQFLNPPDQPATPENANNRDEEDAQ